MDLTTSSFPEQPALCPTKPWPFYTGCNGRAVLLAGGCPRPLRHQGPEAQRGPNAQVQAEASPGLYNYCPRSVRRLSTEHSPGHLPGSL